MHRDRLKPTNGQSLPVLHVKAESHYELGQIIGSSFKGWVSEFMGAADDMKVLRKFYNSPAGKEIYDEYLDTTRRCYPNTLSEIQGMADGSGQTFEDMFLLQIVSEVSFCHQYELFGTRNPDGNVVKGCTDILVNSESVRLIGHNDDWTDDVATRTCIVHVTLYEPISNNEGDHAQEVHITEEFVSYMYPGSLPGFCFGMNKDLVVTLNTLTPKRAVRKGVPVQILLRQLLACTTIDSCAKVMENAPVGCAYGMNINIACIRDRDMCTMEVYPRENGTEVAVTPLSMDTSGVSNHRLHHQNHYKYIQNVEEVDFLTVGSKRRGTRVNELDIPLNETDVRNILGDTKDDLEPVYCTPDVGHIEANLMTSATAIFNLTEKRLDVYRCNPKLALMPCLTIPFLA